MKHSFLNKWEAILSKQQVTIAIVTIAVLARLIQTVYFFHLGVDRSFQSLAAYNLVAGHGVSIAHIFANDLATPVYMPLVNWPPGYSLLLAPLYILFNHNYYLAGFTLCFGSILILIFVSRKILKLLNVPLFLINIYTFLSAFFIHYFQFLTDTDGIATAFYLIALYYTLLLLQTKRYWKRRTGYAIICLVACAVLKYLFIPLVFVLPVFVLAKSFADRDTILRKSGLVSFSVLFLAVLTLLFYQKSISGTAAYISEPGRGFYPEHLLDAYALIPGAFLSLDSVQKIFGVTVSKHSSLYFIYEVLHILLFGSLLLFVARDVYKKKLRNTGTTKSFYLIAFLLALTTIILLAGLSLWVAPEENNGVLWTYLEDARYYCLATVLIHMAAFVFLAYCWKSASKRLCYFFFILILFMVPEAFRGLLFTANRIEKFKKEEYTWQAEYTFSAYAGKILEKENLQNPNRVIITGSSWFLNNRVSLYNHVPIIEESEIAGNSRLNTSAAVTVVAIVHKDSIPQFQQLVGINKPVGYDSGYYFYTIHVNPN